MTESSMVSNLTDFVSNSSNSSSSSTSSFSINSFSSFSGFDETLTRYRLAINVYVTGVLILFGICGNVLSLIVLGREDSIRRTTGWLLQMLAVADIIFLVFCIVMQTFRTIVDSTDWMPLLTKYWPYVLVYAFPLTSIAQTVTVWLVVAVTADRYVAICKPLHANRFSTMSKNRIIVISVWILTIIGYIPRFFELDVLTIPDPATNGTRFQMTYTDLRNDPTFFLVYETVFLLLTCFLVPFSFVAFFNTRLIQSIRQSGAFRKETEASNRHTMILIAVVFVFVVCEIPALCIRIWLALRVYVPSMPFPLPAMFYVLEFNNFFLIINSSVNFIIYCFMGQKFREVLRQTLSCGSRKGFDFNKERKPSAPTSSSKVATSFA